MGPPDTPSVGCRRPLGASVKPLRYLPLGSLVDTIALDSGDLVADKALIINAPSIVELA
jgi:hypothetical protein